MKHPCCIDGRGCQAKPQSIRTELDAGRVTRTADIRDEGCENEWEVCWQDEVLTQTRGFYFANARHEGMCSLLCLVLDVKSIYVDVARQDCELTDLVLYLSVARFALRVATMRKTL
jgi:hypothetical protein